MKMCIACGMPMERREDHAMGDNSKAYCKHCARPDGSMRSYSEAVEGMSQWMVRTQGLDAAIAKTMAVETLAKLPAWKGKLNAV
jgi:hypothetical protein